MRDRPLLARTCHTARSSYAGQSLVQYTWQGAVREVWISRWLRVELHCFKNPRKLTLSRPTWFAQAMNTCNRHTVVNNQCTMTSSWCGNSACAYHCLLFAEIFCHYWRQETVQRRWLASCNKCILQENQKYYSSTVFMYAAVNSKEHRLSCDAALWKKVNCKPFIDWVPFQLKLNAGC
jgi:hypothetical protein